MEDEKLKKDAEDLRKAMEGAGTKESTIINIAGNRNLMERLQIKDYYKAMFGRDLLEDLKSELSGYFQKTILALFNDPIENDVTYLHDAIEGLGTDNETLIEILASRSAEQLKKIQEKYLEKYKVTLEKDVVGDTSGFYRKLCVSILQCGRSTNEAPVKETCVEIAEKLFKAGEGKLGTDEETFIRYIANSSPAELAAIAREYHKLSGNTLTKAIESEFSGNIKDFLIAILYSQISPSEYFATKIMKSIKGLGTNDKMLVRVVVGRFETDMARIRQYFKQLYQKDLITEVEDDVSGDYKSIISALCSK